MRRWAAVGLAIYWISAASRAAQARRFGVELFSMLVPVSGGMAGASIANLEDNVAAINGNPATLASYRGRSFETNAAFAALLNWRNLRLWNGV